MQNNKCVSNYIQEACIPCIQSMKNDKTGIICCNSDIISKAKGYLQIGKLEYVSRLIYP